MRAMAEVAGKKLGQPVVVDNRVGASGTLAPATMAATAKPDGYTISQTVLPLVRVALMQKVTYDPARDFTYIANLTAYTFGIVAKADGPFKNWADVVKYAKENPGKITYASPGVGTSLHVGMEELSAREQIKVTHVPMKGAGDSSAAVLGNHVMLQVDATNWKPLVEAGQLQPLMVWSQARLKSLPNVPTLSELVPSIKDGGGIPAMFESPSASRAQRVCRRRREEVAGCFRSSDQGRGRARDARQIRHVAEVHVVGAVTQPSCSTR